MAQIYKYESETTSVRRVFIATPATTGVTSPIYQLSLLRSIEVAKKEGFSITWCMLANNCHVDDSRNYLVREFLESDCNDLFFIDADVGWQENDFIKMLKSDKQVIGGVYPKKSDFDEEWPVRLQAGEMWTDEDGWLEVNGIPTGFLRMKRSAVQALYDAEPQKFNNNKDKERKKQAIIFERTFKNNSRTGGDFAMCEKWLNLGGKIFTDPEMHLVHEGSKEWGGRLAYHLRRKHGLLEEQIVDILREIEKGEYTEENLAQLYEAWGNGKWTVSAELLSSVTLMLNEGNYGNVLELGSGLSTLILAALSKRKGFSVESVEEDKQWFFIVKRYLDKLEYDVNLVYAPLKSNWYDYTPDKEFDFVLCDGPCRKGKTKDIRANIALIKDSFVSGCVLVVDDFNESFKTAFEDFKFNPYSTFAIGMRR